MTSTTFFFVFIPLLAIILLAVNLIFAPHNPYQEKDSAFECGFHSFLGQNRTQFSISFFIFALLFLLFDLEILLVYPYVVSAYTNGIYGLTIMLIFFLALTLGFAFELGKNALKIDSRQMLVISNNKLSTTAYVSSLNRLIDNFFSNFTLAKVLGIVITVTFGQLLRFIFTDTTDIVNYAPFFKEWILCLNIGGFGLGILGVLTDFLGIRGLNFNLKGLLYDRFTLKLGPQKLDLSNVNFADKSSNVNLADKSFNDLSDNNPTDLDKGKGIQRSTTPTVNTLISTSHRLDKNLLLLTNQIEAEKSKASPDMKLLASLNKNFDSLYNERIAFNATIKSYNLSKAESLFAASKLDSMLRTGKFSAELDNAGPSNRVPYSPRPSSIASYSSDDYELQQAIKNSLADGNNSTDNVEGSSKGKGKEE